MRANSFAPQQIPGVSLYLDYQKSFAPAQWSDLSGRGNHYLQATGANQGAYNAKGIAFDGVNTFYTGPGADTISGSSDWTMIWGGQIDVIDTNGANIWQNDAIISDGPGLAFGVFLKSAPSVATFNWDGAAQTSGALTIPLTTPMILTARVVGGASTDVRLNGGTLQSGATGARIADAGITELGRGNSANLLQGFMKYVVFIKGVADSNSVVLTQRWMAGKMKGITVP